MLVGSVCVKLTQDIILVLQMLQKLRTLISELSVHFSSHKIKMMTVTKQNAILMIIYHSFQTFLIIIIIYMIFLIAIDSIYLTWSKQHVWNPAPGASRQKPVPLQFLLLLHRHVFHCGLWRCDSTHMAFTAASGHHDLRGSRGATPAGTTTSN